jgi:hypothetical protein
MANLVRNWTSLATPLSQMWHGVGETSARLPPPALLCKDNKLEERISPKTPGDFECRICGPSWCKYHQQSFMMQMANLKCVCHLPLRFHLVSCWLPPPSAMAHENGRRHNNKCGQFQTYGIGTPPIGVINSYARDWQSPLKINWSSDLNFKTLCSKIDYCTHFSLAHGSSPIRPPWGPAPSQLSFSHHGPQPWRLTKKWISFFH